MKVQRPTFDQLRTLEGLTPRERRAVFANPYSFLLFFSYYFHEFVKCPFAPFHLEWAEDFGDLVTDKINELALITSRDTAKSSFATAFFIQCLVNKWFNYPNVDCFERDNSERILFEVVNNLQTNLRIRQDYGELFNAPKRTEEKTQKRITDFVTTTGIRCEAHTTGEPVRGRRHRENRPDLVVLDDFENLKTIRSEAATKEVAEHIAEFKGGLDQKRGKVIYLGNRLSEDGNVAKLMARAKDDPKLRLRTVWMIGDDGQPTWPERHVLTDDELRLHPEKVSIESIRRAMRDPDTGDADFEREMLGNVIDPFGNGPDKQGYLPLLPDFTPVRATFSANPPHAIGVDPSGDGDDEAAIVIRSPFQAFVYWTAKKASGKSIAKAVMDAMRDYDVTEDRIVVDSFGIGVETVQELSLQGYRVKAVNVGDVTEELCGEKYFNDRAYAYFKLKEWLAGGGALDNDTGWEREAKTLRFLTDGHNKRRMMPKKEIVKRGMRSPNKMDALMLTFFADLDGPLVPAVAQSRSALKPYGRKVRAS